MSGNATRFVNLSTHELFRKTDSTPHQVRGRLFGIMRSSHHRPIRRDAVIIVDVAAARRIPFPLLAGGVMRSVLELLVGEVDLVAAKLGVVGQPLPRNRIMVLAHAEEP